MKILRCWCSNPTGGKLFAINLLFTTKQYKVDNIVNFVYYGKTRLAKAKIILNIWQSQDLSLLGSILICNSLITPLFVYRLMNTELLSKTFINRYDALIRKFIWKGNKPKISLQMLQGNKDQGGLGLANIEYRDKSLKIQWIANLLKDPLMKSLPYDAMDNPIGDLIWNSNLKKEDLSLFSRKENFWLDVFKSWLEYKENPVDSKDKVCNQMIWLNSNIRIDNKPICKVDWIKRGIIKIRDLINEHDEFLGWSQITQKLGIQVPFTEYYGIIQALPIHWKRWLKDNTKGAPYQDEIKLITNRKSVSQCCYHKINSDPTLFRNLSKRWSNSHDIEVTVEHMEQAIRRLFVITNVPRLRSFQYRMLLKTTITNIQLHRFKIKETEMCTFCEEHVETLKHLFYECRWVRNLWSEIEKLCSTSDRSKVLSFENILYVNITPNAKLMQNFLVLAAKYFIYRSRCENKKLLYSRFINYIYMFKDMEEYIARKNNALNLHQAKWALISEKM